MSDLTTYEDSPNVTSSPESASGLTPYDRRDGRIANPPGPDHARANLSARQAKQAGLMMSGTCGLPSSTSSRSADLASCLASRLQARTASAGSTLYRLTWKTRVTPQQRSIFALRASVPRTSANASTGWVTPTTRDWKDTPGMATASRNPDGTIRRRLDQLPRQAFQWAGRVTPTATDSKRGCKPPRPHDKDVPLTQMAGLLDSGQMPTGCPSSMESGVLLNPGLSRWLMGLPEAWDDCTPTATPS